MLVTSTFSFSYNVFCPFQNKFQFFLETFILSSATFSIWTSLKFCHLEESTLYNTILSLNDPEWEGFLKILWQNSLNSFADKTINLTKILKSVCARTERIVGKTESAGYQHLLCSSHNVFNKLLFQG